MAIIKDIMAINLASLKDTDSLYDANMLMKNNRIRHIPILNNELKFIGIITQRDILASTISNLAELNPEMRKQIDSGILLREIMQKDITTVSSDTPIIDVAEFLLKHKYGCLPIVDNEKLVGIVTETDFLKLSIKLLKKAES